MLYPPSRARQRVFWRSIRAEGSVVAASAAAGVSSRSGRIWLVKAGGMPPLQLDEPCRELTFIDRELIFQGLFQGWSYAEIGRQLGRPTSTVTRELQVNRLRPELGRAEPVGREKDRVGRPATRLNYSPSIAQARSDERRARPQQTKLAGNARLREEVQTRLSSKHSPEEIAGRLRRDFPDDPTMWVSHETIYRALYVQGRGALRQELTRCLRTGRSVRKPRRRGPPPPPLAGGVSISQRPPEAADRAVPGHFEGDLIIGAGTRSAIATVVERRSRFTLLGHLPGGHTAEEVSQALIVSLHQLPDQVRAHTLTWDRGTEMAQHHAMTIATGAKVFFCDPASPWQRPTNENTNGLLRQYFPKGTDLSVHPAEHLAFVAAELNDRPRKCLGFRTPAEVFYEILTTPPTTSVATTR